MDEAKWDKLLGIKTGGRDDSRADTFHYPYEPTPYAVLERLAESGYIGKKNTLIDYGCGKGRVDFYLSYQTKCRSIGIEYDERMYERAMDNRATAAAAGRTSFVLQSAEEFVLPEEADACYFFNPFSVEILKTVLARISESYYDTPRAIRMFFYYPSDEYVAAMMNEDLFLFVDEIDCSDLFPGMDEREKILIFEISE